MDNMDLISYCCAAPILETSNTTCPKCKENNGAVDLEVDDFHEENPNVIMKA